MAGIYLHIPFCKQACVYCDFHFSTRQSDRQAMVSALLREADLRQNYLPDQKIQSIYFGGGTPSVLPTGLIAQMIKRLKRRYTVAEDAEICFEANPDDLSLDYLQGLAKSGVNRLSIGVQSFRESDLRFMNRAHSATQSLQCIAHARAAGFTNFSIDLIYALPGQSDEDWRTQLDQLAALELPHFSAYALTVEPKTVLHHRIRKGEIAAVEDEKSLRHFRILQAFAQREAYQHYELSNFCQPGHAAVHNSLYWQGDPYLGLGPSAHSFDGHSRQWNLANNPLYLKALQSDTLPFTREVLSAGQHYNESIMTALRLQEGLSLSALARNLGQSFHHYCLREAAPELERGRLIIDEDRLRIPPAWRFHSDGIAAQLFFMEDE